MIVDGRITLSIVRSDDYYRLKVDMRVREDWQPADFDRLREVDRILDRLDLPIVPIPSIGRSFFQGKVVE